VTEAAAQGVVITMLANDEALAAVAKTLLDTLPAGGVHIVMGTHGVPAIRTLAAAHAEKGQTLVAAPVLGRPEAVTAGLLGIVVAGPEAAVAQVQPLFDAIGRRSFIAGTEPTAAAAIKIANNFLLGCSMEAMGEAFALVQKSGGAPGLFYEVITAGLFNCPAYTIYGKIIAEGNYDNPGFTANLGLKDANLALSAGESVGVPMPSGSAWRDRLVGAIAHGEGEKDWAVVAREQQRASGML
jgi:3-hydroxyisobutyrate dehydrogenase-like beta-hydroxyacid dehydrogenase